MDNKDEAVEKLFVVVILLNPHLAASSRAVMSPASSSTNGKHIVSTREKRRHPRNHPRYEHEFNLLLLDAFTYVVNIHTAVFEKIAKENCPCEYNT